MAKSTQTDTPKRPTERQALAGRIKELRAEISRVGRDRTRTVNERAARKAELLAEKRAAEAELAGLGPGRKTRKKTDDAAATFPPRD